MGREARDVERRRVPVHHPAPSFVHRVRVGAPIKHPHDRTLILHPAPPTARRRVQTEPAGGGESPGQAFAQASTAGRRRDLERASVWSIVLSSYSRTVKPPARRLSLLLVPSSGKKVGQEGARRPRVVRRSRGSLCKAVVRGRTARLAPILLVVVVGCNGGGAAEARRFCDVQDNEAKLVVLGDRIVQAMNAGDRDRRDKLSEQWLRIVERGPRRAYCVENQLMFMDDLYKGETDRSAVRFRERVRELRGIS